MFSPVIGTYRQKANMVACITTVIIFVTYTISPAWNTLVCVWLVAQSRLHLCDPMDCSPPGSSVRGDSLSKNIGIGCHALLQGIFPTQGSNPGVPH